MTINLPNAPRPLVITSIGAPSKPYIKSLTVNGKPLDAPLLGHGDIAYGGQIVFEMSDQPQAWGSATLVGFFRTASRYSAMAYDPPTGRVNCLKVNEPSRFEKVHGLGMDGYDSGLATTQLTRRAVAVRLGRPPMNKFMCSIQAEVGR